MPRAEDPQADAQHRLGRVQGRKVESRRATQRLIGSYVLGGIAAWKLLTYDAAAPVPWYVWVGVALVSFGLASWDQVANIIKR